MNAAQAMKLSAGVKVRWKARQEVLTVARGPFRDRVGVYVMVETEGGPLRLYHDEIEAIGD